MRAADLCAPRYPTANQMMIPLMSNGPYRPAQQDYHFPGEPTVYGGQYGTDYPEEISDYNNVSYHQNLHHEPVNMGYNNLAIPTMRAYTPLLSQKSQGMSYYDPIPTYSQAAHHQQHPRFSTPYTIPVRSSIPSDSTSFSFSGMASNLPVPSQLTSHERVLPVPSSQSVPPKYVDAMGYSTAAPVSSSSQATQHVKPLNTSSAGLTNMPAQGMYMRLSSSPNGTISSTSSYDSNTTTQSEQEMYSNTGKWATGDLQDAQANTVVPTTLAPEPQHLSMQHLIHQTQMPLLTRRSHADLGRQDDTYTPLPLANRRSHAELARQDDVFTYPAQVSVTESGETTPHLAQHTDTRKYSLPSNDNGIDRGMIASSQVTVSSTILSSQGYDNWESSEHSPQQANMSRQSYDDSPQPQSAMDRSAQYEDKVSQPAMHHGGSMNSVRV